MDATDKLIGRLHQIAIREKHPILAATCLIALGETDGNPTWSIREPAVRARLDAMTRDNAIRQCMAVIDARDDLEQEYRIAFATESGDWEIADRFWALDDDAANAFAEENYGGRAWYVLDHNGRNINGGPQ